MKSYSSLRYPGARRTAAALCGVLPVIGALYVAACATSSSSAGSASAASQATSDLSTSAPTPDRRIGLGAGWLDAVQASWNMRLVSMTPPPEQFIDPGGRGEGRFTNSDLAFFGNYVVQGNYSGWQIWDISDPRKPALVTAYVCPGAQNDVSVHRNLLFVSAEAVSGRLDCGTQGVPDTVSLERMRGIRIFDISDIARPKYVASVQTCRGSHTHTLVTDPNDTAHIYIYVSGSAAVRSPQELPGCSVAPLEEDAHTALFRIEVIRVPLAAPHQARIVSSPRIFTGLAAPPRHAELPEDTAGRGARALRAAGGAGGAAGAGGAGPGAGGGGVSRRVGPTQCHDITVYPEIGLAGGACGGYGLLLDIRDVANPVRIGAVADSNFVFWHSATFSNDGSKLLFTDEWGGGSQPRCRATDRYEWGANALFTLTRVPDPHHPHHQMTFQSYYKMPAPQTGFENCVAHNGSLIPIPGRDVMVQGWYQGGVSVFDWTEPAHPKEIAYFDRGPLDSTRLVTAGSWSAYWYNGYIISSEISRGLDIFELTPSALLSQNEIDAARTVRVDYFNAQQQRKLVWPATFVLARAYLDQLARLNGLALERVAAAREELARAQKLSRPQRREALARLASRLEREAETAAGQAKVRALAAALRELADAQL